MARALVHQEAARAVLVAVPAPEIVGAVHAVEIPAGSDRLHLADHARHQDVLELGARRGIAVVEGHGDAAAGFPLRVEHAVELCEVDRHRLFGDDVAARSQRPHDTRDGDGRARSRSPCRAAARRSSCRTRPQGGDAVARLRRRFAHREREARLVDVAQRDKFVVLLVGVGDRFAEHLVAPAGADNRVLHLQLFPQRRAAPSAAIHRHASGTRCNDPVTISAIAQAARYSAATATWCRPSTTIGVPDTGSLTIRAVRPNTASTSSHDSSC